MGNAERAIIYFNEANSFYRLTDVQKKRMTYKKIEKENKNLEEKKNNSKVIQLIKQNKHSAKKILALELVKTSIFKNKNYNKGLRNNLTGKTIRRIEDFETKFRDSIVEVNSIIKTDFFFFLMDANYLSSYSLERIYKRVSFRAIDLSGKKIINKQLKGIKISDSNLLGTYFQNVNLTDAQLNYSLVDSLNWFDRLLQTKNQGIKNLQLKYTIKKNDKKFRVLLLD